MALGILSTEKQHTEALEEFKIITLNFILTSLYSLTEKLRRVYPKVSELSR